MERDFLGLNSKAAVAVVNEEFKDGGKEPGMAGNSGVQWMAFSNKLTAVPQFTSFRATTQEGRQKRLMFDPQMPSTFQPVSTSVFDSNYKPTDGLVQKTFNIERQGTHFAMPYPAQPVDAHGISALCGHEMRTFPVSKHSISPAMNNPFFKVYGSNIATASMKQHPLGGIPVTAPHSVFPVPGSMAGTYASWNNPRSSANSSQLTIFYKGTVNVYDDISAEKAQALMFSARNANANQMKPGTQLQALALAHPKPEPSSGHSSPVSVTSQHNAQSGSGSSNPADLLASKPIGVLSVPPNSQQESAPKMATSASATLMQQAVPQARKASLARFLEKRKERVMNVAPYALCKKSQESTPGSEVGGKSATASVDLMGNQDQSWSLGQYKQMDNPAVETKLEI